MSDKISVVVHTYNNEKIIRECLESIKDFDEIVLCDMYSTDKTLDIAKEYNCKIIMHEKTGFVEPARNFAISNASFEWVLVVDSDEIITEKLREYLYYFIKNSQNYSAISIPRITYGWGEALEVLYPDKIMRFYKRDFVYYPPEIHSTPQIKQGDIYYIDKNRRELAILHKQERSISGWINIINQYTDIELEKKIKENKEINFWAHSWKSLFIIFEKFLFKRGYKNGIRGFIICVIVFGFYKFVLGCKYWEYLLNKKEP